MLDRRLCIAPMMGYTDRHYRQLLRMISPHAVLYTEMVVANALVHGDAGPLLAHGDDAPCALQLGGSDPSLLASCAAMAEEAGYQEINLNVGCPSDRVQSGVFGACLMAEPDLVGECIAAMQARVDIPVTVKTRIGIADRLDVQDDYAFFHDFVQVVHDAGCRVFIIHARKAVLAGLSPRENREVPPLRYDFVHRIRAEFPTAQFILNGGIRDRETALTQLHRTDGIMLGRIACADPWMLATLERDIFANHCADRLSILADYRDYIDRQMRTGQNFRHMARHLLGFFSGCPGARAFRRHLSEAMSRDDATNRVIDEALLVSGLDQVDRLQTGT